MKLSIVFLAFYYFFSVQLNILYAQVNNSCSGNFQALNESCISTRESQFSQNKLEVNSSLVNNIYFYKTFHNHYGKFKVISVVNDTAASGNDKLNGRLSCVVNIEATTFVNKKVLSSPPPGNILSIKSEQGNWQKDQISFDKYGPNDLALVREDGKCFLKPIQSKIGFFAKSGEKDHLKEGSQMLYWASLILIGLAVYLVAKSFLDEENKFKAAETLEEADTTKKPVNDFVLKYSKPFFKRYFSPVVQGMKGRSKLKEQYKQKLANAGLTKELTPEDFYAFKLFLIIGFPILFLVLRAVLEETWPLKAVPFLGVIGYFYPNFWLKGRIDGRKDDIVRAMPFIVDMLALSVEAGLDFMAAMQKVIERAPKTALVEEFETLIKETKIGSSRAEGLRQLAYRVDVLAVNSFCATLVAADSVGASIGPILKQLANELRQRKSTDAEKKGATAATKILFPMILFIMPAIFFAIAAPIVFEFMGGGVGATP